MRFQSLSSDSNFIHNTLCGAEFIFFKVPNSVLHLIWPNESLASFYEDRDYISEIISLLAMMLAVHENFTQQIINSHSWSQSRVENFYIKNIKIPNTFLDPILTNIPFSFHFSLFL